MIWRKLLWFGGLALVLICLSLPMYPLVALGMYFAGAAAMLPVCIRFQGVQRG